MRAHHVGGVAEETNQPIDRRRDMTRHELKRRSDVHAEPRNHLSVFIANHRELPEVVRYKERDDEDDDIPIGFK